MPSISVFMRGSGHKAWGVEEGAMDFPSFAWKERSQTLTWSGRGPYQLLLPILDVCFFASRWALLFKRLNYDEIDIREKYLGRL